MAAWEHAKEIFKNGTIPGTDGASIDTLDDSIPYISFAIQDRARATVIRENVYVWGKDGEFNVFTPYNIMDPDLSPGGEFALNAYGYIMLENYKQLNLKDYNI